MQACHACDTGSNPARGAWGVLLSIDITKHDLVPKHTVLNENEKTELLGKYGINIAQLPRILVTDPVILAIQGKIGDVVKIARKSQTAGESVYYRVVVKG